MAAKPAAAPKSSLESELEDSMDFGADLLAAASGKEGNLVNDTPGDLEKLEMESMGFGDLSTLEDEVSDMDPEDRKRKIFMQKQRKAIKEQHQKKVKEHNKKKRALKKKAKAQSKKLEEAKKALEIEQQKQEKLEQELKDQENTQLDEPKPSAKALEEKSRLVARLAQAKVEKKFEDEMWQ